MDDIELAHTPFDAILEAAVDGVIVIDSGGIIEKINRAAGILFGYESSKLIGKNVSELMPQPDRRSHDNYINSYLTTGERKMIGIGRKTTGQRRDGTCFPMYLSVGHIDAVTGPRFVGIIRDLTEEEETANAARKNEKDAQNLRERLSQVARISSLGEMASGIAHEINQPLTAIATYAQACRRLFQSGTAQTADLVNALDKIDEQSRRAGKVVSSVRNLSKKHAMKLQDYVCIDLINDVVGLTLGYAQENNCLIKVELSKISDSLCVHVDEVQTQQVLLNLINNAVESMIKGESESEDGRTVFVEALPHDDDSVEINVIDSGCGIEEVDKENIFDAFFTTKPNGLGMGLSICQSIIQAQGGRIYCENNQFGGTTFSVILPISIEK